MDISFDDYTGWNVSHLECALSIFILCDVTFWASNSILLNDGAWPKLPLMKWCVFLFTMYYRGVDMIPASFCMINRKAFILFLTLHLSSVALLVYNFVRNNSLFLLALFCDSCIFHEFYFIVSQLIVLLGYVWHFIHFYSPMWCDNIHQIYEGYNFFLLSKRSKVDSENYIRVTFVGDMTSL